MAAKKPSFVSGMVHQYDVVGEQVEIGLANIKHFFKFLEKICECMPQDFVKAVKGAKPLEGDVMTQYSFVTTQTENVLLQYFNHERDMFIKMNEVVVKPLGKFHAANVRLKRSLDLDLAKFNKQLRDAKTILQRDELECRSELEKYIKMHNAQLELRKNNKDALPESTSAYEKFLSGAELDTFKKQQLNANADAAAKSSPMYADYRRQKKRTFELFNKYELQLAQVRIYQGKFHEYVCTYLNELESMERYRLKSIEVFLRKLLNLFEYQSQRLRETLEGIDGMCQTVANLDEQQLQHSIKVWDFMYGPAPPFQILEYRLPCKANEIMDDYRTNFETCPAPVPKQPYVAPKGNPPPFIPERTVGRIQLGGAPLVMDATSRRNEAKSSFLAESGQNVDLLEWPQTWDLTGFMKSWRGVAVFKQFLEGEFSSENLIFWIKANRYRSDLQAINAEGEPYVLDRHLTAAFALYGEFVAPGSPRELNLPSVIRSAVKTSLDEAVTYRQKYDSLGQKAQQKLLEEEKPPDLTELYHPAQDCIFRLVERDSYERFKRTKTFEQFQQEAENGNSAPPTDEGVGEVVERACSQCGKALGPGVSKFCATCKLRQARVEKEVEDAISPTDDTSVELSIPISGPQTPASSTPTASTPLSSSSSSTPVTSAANGDAKGVSKSYTYNNTPLKPSPPADLSVYALKSDMELLRKDVEALRIHVQSFLKTPEFPVPKTPEPPLKVPPGPPSKPMSPERPEKRRCVSCGTHFGMSDRFCTNCGLACSKQK